MYRMLRSMSSRELRDWQYYSELEPFGEIREDWRFAHLACTVANILRDGKRHPNPYAIKDFLLKFETEEHSERPIRKQSWQDLKAMAVMLVKASQQGSAS